MNLTAKYNNFYTIWVLDNKNYKTNNNKLTNKNKIFSKITNKFPINQYKNFRNNRKSLKKSKKHLH